MVNGSDSIEWEVLGESASFGEASFFTEMASRSSVMSRGITRVMCLPRAKYHDLAAAHPMDNKQVVDNLMRNQEEVGFRLQG